MKLGKKERKEKYGLLILRKCLLIDWKITSFLKTTLFSKKDLNS